MGQDTLKNKFRGCLMAGAAGDALGYEYDRYCEMKPAGIGVR